METPEKAGSMNTAVLDHGTVAAAATNGTAPTTPSAACGHDPTTSPLVSRAVKRAQEGDREALGFLYARYADNVCGYVRGIVHDQHEAEHVTEHVFAKLIHVIGTYEQRDIPFLVWLLRVSRNIAVDHIRRQRAIRSRTAAPAAARSQRSHSEASASG